MISMIGWKTALIRKQASTTWIISAIVSASLLPVALAEGPTACQDMASLALPNASITTTLVVEAGAFSAPSETGGAARARDVFKKLPTFCRIAATIKPTSDSEIKMEVWLPASGWNGRLQVVGNGGWAGSISYPAMARALVGGYATASTNTGHDGDRADFAPGHPEKLIDFAGRAMHLTTVQSREIVKTFYGDPAKYAYYNGCSSGGKQGLKEAQKYPDDFDGIIAGSSANNWNRQKAAFVYKYQQMHKTPESFVPKEKYEMLHNAVLKACDALDGVVDGVIENPLACHFDPAVLLCKGEDGPACLTAPQVAAMKTMYAPTRTSKGEYVFPGMAFGTELELGTFAGVEPRTTQTDLFTYVVYNDPKWDLMTFDLDKGLALAEKVDSTVGVAATDPNLKPLLAHNGKLLLYHGFSDPNIMPENTMNYYKSAVAASGGEETTKDAIRLFMVPGMGHCGGGLGPNEFDMMAPLTEWVEKGRTPDRIIASRITNGVVTRTRPLCAYPKVAKYKGTGSTDNAANFVCGTQ